MNFPQFAIAVQWPDEKQFYLVHVQKPYFVASVHVANNSALFFSSITGAQLQAFGEDIGSLLRAASGFTAAALGIELRESHFLKGNHGRDFPRFLMARTENGKNFIVEPDHPSPLVEVKEPKQSEAPASRPKLSQRFDVVTQWRLNEMRRYYQHFIERQNAGAPVLWKSAA